MLETKLEEKYKPSLLVKTISWLVSRFDKKPLNDSYNLYLKKVARHITKENFSIYSIYEVPVPEELIKKHNINDKNKKTKTKNLLLTSACFLSSHYTNKALNKTLEILIKSNVGALPGDILKKVAIDVKQRYGIEEKPEDYVKYSLAIGAINSALLMAASYQLINLPETPGLPFLKSAIEVLGNFKLWLTRYTLFAEIPTRTAFLYNKQILGILPLEFGYRIYKPFIEPSLKNFYNKLKTL